MQEDNLLSLSYGRIIRKDIDSAEGLLPESFETYQVVEPGNIVMRLTDLQNDKRSLRQGLVMERGIITSAYDALEVGKDSDPRFWAYALLALDLAKYYYSLGGGVRQSVKFSDFPNEWLATPDAQTQKSIADFLDHETARIDQLVRKKERQAALLSERLATFTEALLSGRSHRAAVETRGRSGHIRFLPEGWVETRLRFGIRRIEQGWSPQCDDREVEGDEWGVLKLGAITTGVFIERAHKALPPDLQPIPAYAVRDGDVLIARASGSPALVGKACLVNRVTRNLMLSDKHFRIDLDERKFDRSFFVHVVNSPLSRLQIETQLSSAEGMARNVGQEVIRGLWLALPPRSEQTTIARRIDAYATRISSATERLLLSIAHLREFRAALITAAVTGKIEIREKLPAVSSKPDRSRFRVIVGAEIVHQHQSNPKFGRVKLQKELYLAEAHLGIDGLQGNYLREAAGPLDRALIEETERGLKAAGFYRASQRDGTGTAVTYTPLAMAGQHKAELESLLGSKIDELRSLIAMLRDLDRREVEAVATLYAVWNDALMDGEEPDDAVIINGVLTEWHTEKGEKFKTDELSRWLGWMKRHSLTPRGRGPRTAHTATREMFA
jgi:type I restriction enzyme S subunit